MADIDFGGVKDLYPTERNALISIKHQLMSELAYKGATLLFTEDMMRRQFEERARNRCGEIGFAISVLWEWQDPENEDLFSPTVSDDPNDMNVYYLPRLIIDDRIDKIDQIDHDRIKAEVTAGEADGKAGFIDPNTGTFKDDPKKKLIL